MPSVHVLTLDYTCCQTNIFSFFHTDQASSSNASMVGSMAESFAQQGWSIACGGGGGGGGGGGSGPSSSPFSGRRSFSTCSSASATTG